MRVDTVVDKINQTELMPDMKGTASSTEYDSNDFMQMLMAQLTHQNPLEPLGDAEMMSQFTQLNSLQQLQQIETAIQKVTQDSQMTYASSLMGKIVVLNISDGDPVEGKVSGFSLESGQILLQIDGHNYPLEDVIKVQEEIVNG